MKRWFIDSLANWLFFTPLVLAINGWGWSLEAILIYMVGQIPVSVIGARAYTYFLKRWWYHWWREAF